MAVTPQAREIPGGAEELDKVARRLFGKRYIKLNDAEAGTVWDEIDFQDDYGRDAGFGGQDITYETDYCSRCGMRSNDPHHEFLYADNGTVSGCRAHTELGQ